MSTAVAAWTFIAETKQDRGHAMASWPRKHIRNLRMAMGQAKIDSEMLYSACFYIPGDGFRLIASTKAFDMATGAATITTLPSMANLVPSSITGKVALKVVAPSPAPA